MSLDSPLHLAAHPQPLDSVTVYSSPMVIPVTDRWCWMVPWPWPEAAWCMWAPADGCSTS